MGYKNRELMKEYCRACRNFGKASPKARAASKKIDESQERCPHSSTPHLSQVKAKTLAKSATWMRDGDLFEWCPDCGLPLRINNRPYREVKEERRRTDFMYPP
jgi:hypothetical protein